MEVHRVLRCLPEFASASPVRKDVGSAYKGVLRVVSPPGVSRSILPVFDYDGGLAYREVLRVASNGVTRRLSSVFRNISHCQFFSAYMEVLRVASRRHPASSGYSRATVKHGECSNS